jgi:hypothetical protein
MEEIDKNQQIQETSTKLMEHLVNDFLDYA